MKKNIVLLGAALLILDCFSFSYAAGLGPVRPLGNKKICVGFEKDYVFSRPIKANLDVSGGKIKDGNRDSILLGLGLTKYFNVYAKLGMGDWSEQLKWVGSSSEQTIEYNNGFTWGVGADALYSFENNFGVGFDAQFDMASNKAGFIGGTDYPAITGRGPVKTYEIQMAPYLTYDMKINDKVKIMPYAGGYYSFYNIYKGITFDDNYGWYETGDEKIRRKHALGLLGGFEMLFFNQLALKAEGRFLSETALTASVTYTF